MKIIDQYVEAVGRKLPMKGRRDIKLELKSLLLDEIESEYGENPTEEDVNKAIIRFGSPSSVSERYAGSSSPISAEYSDLYFLIIKIIPFAMAVAFLVIFIMDLILDNPGGREILISFGRVLMNTATGSVSGIGVVTILFIALSRLTKGRESRAAEDWNPDELADIELEDEKAGTAGSIFGMVFLLILTVVVLSLMLGDESLYLNDNGYIGFKLIFLIVLIVSAVEIVAEGGKLLIRLIRERLES